MTTDDVPALEPEYNPQPAEAAAITGKPDWHGQPRNAPDPWQAADTILKVRTSSRPSAVAGTIAGVIRQVGQAELQAIGAGAINQAVKAIAIARSYLQDEGIDLWCVPSFIDLVIDEEERTALRLVIEVQQR